MENSFDIIFLKFYQQHLLEVRAGILIMKHKMIIWRAEEGLIKHNIKEKQQR